MVAAGTPLMPPVGSSRGAISCISMRPICASVSRVRHVGKCAQGVRLAGEDEAVRVAVIEDGALAHVIAAEHELVRAPVPDGEGEVAEQMLGAVFAPVLVGAHAAARCRACRAARLAPMPKAVSQFFAVVEPQVGDQRQFRRRDRRSGCALELVFRA